MITVSTDGSCLRNPGGAVGWAWINHDGTFDAGGAASGTNQTAELTALLEAVRAHPGDEPLMIESDSQYAIKCASEWLEGWRRKGWKTASGSPVKNLELVQLIDRAISEREGPVRFRWVRGHVGNPFNERADQLAGHAAQDWASGRGDLDAVFGEASPLVEGATSRRPSSAREEVAATTGTKAATERPAEPAWSNGTLFD
ncbi:ribonuclease H family protein [Paraoerskovia marina]|uniref:ribonuclease H family protein n=1 Tax=Paraoerskovia marina TaxID=545619 RepID=UPI0004927866|nr:ribonuclease H [Paraoerskovia marina]